MSTIKKENKFVILSKKYPAVYMILVSLLAFAIISPYFMTVNNMRTIMAGNSVILIAALGETMVLLTGGIDLSVATVISASAVMAGYVMNITGSITIGLIVAVATGLVFGIVNGVLIGYFGMTSFITTMGTQLISSGVAYYLSQGIAVPGTPSGLVEFGSLKLFGIPSLFVVAIVLLVICVVLVGYTTWGRNVLLLGANRYTAEYSGINVKLTETSVYVCAGLFAGIAGFVSISNLGFAIPGVGDTLLMVILGGIVLGGTAMAGGEGSIPRTLIGVALLAILINGLSMVGVPFYDQLVIEGVLIFLGNGLVIIMGKRSQMAM